MKKMSNKGFTLIELLAVITIMGILMLVAIPAVTRTIENSRRDTFADVAGEYLNAVRNGVLADEIHCTYLADDNTTVVDYVVASALPDGIYYFPICTTEGSTVCTAVSSPAALAETAIKQSTLDILESGGKSSFGNADVYGYVTWEKKTDSGKSKTEYRILLQDSGQHGLAAEHTSKELKRSNVMPNLTSTSIKTNVKADESANNGFGAPRGVCKVA